MKSSIVFVFSLAYVNAILVETLYPSIRPECGCRGIELCGCQSRCGYAATDYISECSIDACPIAFLPDFVYTTPVIEPIAKGCGYPLPVCGSELIYNCATIPPLPPVINCPKYLRQITIPPPFL